MEQKKGTHLTLEDRQQIQQGLEEGLSKAQIAKELGKSPSTISKEIKLHRKLKPANRYNRGPRAFCANAGKFGKCQNCRTKCSDFEEKTCRFTLYS